MSFKHIFLCLAGVVLLQAVSVHAAQDNAQAPEPVIDGATPFYVWTEPMKAEPGQLLRQERLQPGLGLENASKGFRILYASESFSGATVAVSGAVFVPKGEAPDGGWPVLAWSHGTVGVADICAPSYSGRSERDVKYLNQWLAAGYAIVATDYEGLGTPGTHAYLHCKSEANGNIDAVQAAQQMQLSLSNRWLVTGQSQGGQGALCTGAYVGQRQSELEFLGSVATAPGVNFMQRFYFGKAEDPNPFIGITLLLARGLETYDPNFKPENAFTDTAMAMMHYTDKACIRELMGLGQQAGLTTGDTLKYIPFSETPGLAEAAAKMEIPETGWGQPVYIAQGTNDELVRYQDTYDFALALCENGSDVWLEVFEGADHSGPMNEGAAKFIQWAGERFSGKAVKNNCEQIKLLVEAEKKS